MNTLQRILLLACAALPMALRAQQGAIGDEHRYRFDLLRQPEPYAAKLLHQDLLAFDPDMRIDVDAEEHALLLLAYRPLPVDRIEQLAQGHGVALRYRKPDLNAEAAHPLER